MNIDELVKKISEVSSEKAAQELSEYLVGWKRSNKTAEELRKYVENFIGDAWKEDSDNHSKIYQLWIAFRDNAILGIEGMTMNERLYWFGLFEIFDSIEDEDAKLNIYNKLHAKP